MGEVYKATDTNLKRAVAIKVLPAFPLDEALPIAKQIAEALEAAHEQGIIHRDLKSANIKVRSDGTVKVLDFGLAKAVEGTGPAKAGHYVPNMSQSPTITTPAMTQAGMILGTAAYMSPEQAKGRTVDRRADVWAFGVAGDGKSFVAVPATPGVSTDESQMSPDGRWISYNSTVSGGSEIYLQPFPGPGERITVSSGGGVQAKWRADSKELFYLSPDGTMMSVDVRPGATPDIGTPKPLFRTRLTPSTAWDQYAVTSDGQRFIVMEPAADAPPESLAVITNWTTLLRK